ncbi:hypothetical protein N8005_06025 [Litorivicinus sp.]|nr:hypothetical protein [Litorivicinus sp.]
MTHDLIHQNRQLLQSDSQWVRQFDCKNIDCLIICRGPIRKEVMDVLTEMGANFGILLSEKDSVTYQHALSPEIRLIAEPTRIHRVPDYTGATVEERDQRIKQIIQIAKSNGHNAIFAGYGFMAEDESLVRAIENAGLLFIGPCSSTVHQAGLKDEAKRMALAIGVSTVPGVNDLTVRTLLTKAMDNDGLDHIASQYGLQSPPGQTQAAQAEALLAASYSALIDVITIDEIVTQAEHEVARLFTEQPNNRIRLKAISGGGGKGQRILKAPKDFDGSSKDQLKKAISKVAESLKEVLNEVKAVGCGDNKNVLIERNIETIRHHEIQVIGNGEWCVTLGARDCSLQMHEQKVWEVSLTQEALEKEIIRSRTSEKTPRVLALQSELAVLDQMESDATRFGQAVCLDSVSTFECIVDNDQCFFMEMNTRIQVEHRVSELCYGLRFENPENPEDSFIVNSLVEAMVLIACHKKNLPKPTRIPREPASVEARLNATNSALAPHAGGIIEHWSSPISSEIRDDQGIGVRNPDTNVFMTYTLAGAYDSNIALLLTVGNDRKESYEAMVEILRKMTISGHDLQTNLPFLYGLAHWLLAQDPYSKYSTAFIQAYLTLAGTLFAEVSKLDFDLAIQYLAADSESDELFARKRILITRPLKVLASNPHLLMGWISKVKGQWRVGQSHFLWTKNPLEVLNELYHFLNMDATAGSAALETIWNHDQSILEQGIQFYKHLESLLGSRPWLEWVTLLSQNRPPNEIQEPVWAEIQAAHIGFQLGLELLGLVASAAIRTGFDELTTNADLTISIPNRLETPELVEKAKKILTPPPLTSTNEIVAISGGMFYAQETPHSPTFIKVGTHFQVGDPLYLIEVMKMFNKVHAEFSGTVTEVLINEEDGVIVKKGQPLYRIEPDEIPEKKDQQAIADSHKKHTITQLKAL